MEDIKIMEINEESYEKIFVVSDIHGKYDLFNELIMMSEIKKTDLLIILGNIIDYGNESFEVVKKIIELKEDGYNILLLKGNHEQFLIEYIREKNKDTKAKIFDFWIKNGGANTLFSLWKLLKKSENNSPEISEKDIEEFNFWLQNTELETEMKNFYCLFDEAYDIILSKKRIFVHAGIELSKLPENQDPFYVSFTDDKTYQKKLILDLYRDKEIFIGHHPVERITVFQGNENIKVFHVNTDAIHRNRLSCIEIKSMEVFFTEYGK